MAKRRRRGGPWHRYARACRRAPRRSAPAHAAPPCRACAARTRSACRPSTPTAAAHPPAPDCAIANGGPSTHREATGGTTYTYFGPFDTEAANCLTSGRAGGGVTQCCGAPGRGRATALASGAEQKRLLEALALLLLLEQASEALPLSYGRGTWAQNRPRARGAGSESAPAFSQLPRCSMLHSPSGLRMLTCVSSVILCALTCRQTNHSLRPGQACARAPAQPGAPAPAARRTRRLWSCPSVRADDSGRTARPRGGPCPPRRPHPAPPRLPQGRRAR